MKQEVKLLLKEKGMPGLFTEERYEIMKLTMKHAMHKDAWLKMFLSLDVLNRASWIVDNMIILINKGLI